MEHQPIAELHTAGSHRIERLRHETRRRRLTVLRKAFVTPNILRVTLGGPDLAGFASPGADDHVKLFLEGGAGTEGERRDYTPRRHDPAAGELDIDFALHDGGPATAWALAANKGSDLEIGGPRGSTIVPADFDWYLLIGDETALPAIGRRIEELRAGANVTSIVAVRDKAEEQAFATRARHEAIWLHRPIERADDPAPFLSALKALDLPAGDGFVWIGAEAHVSRALRAYLVEERGHPLHWLKAAGYWLKGEAGAHEKM